MKQEIVNVYGNIGKVIYRKKTGVKRLTIRIKTSGEIFVTVPYFVSIKHAEQFLLSKITWINKVRNKTNHHQDNISLNDLTEYQTYNHTLRIIRSENEKLSRKISFPYLEVFVPFSADINSPDCQLYILNSIVETYKREALIFLPERLNYFATVHAFKYSGVSTRRMKTRWGSCSGKNKINLNIFLMSLPARLRDYVLLHELVHTVEKNHGPLFWKKLVNICPGAVQLRKELRNYRADVLYNHRYRLTE